MSARLVFDCARCWADRFGFLPDPKLKHRCPAALPQLLAGSAAAPTCREVQQGSGSRGATLKRNADGYGSENKPQQSGSTCAKSPRLGVPLGEQQRPALEPLRDQATPAEAAGNLPTGIGAGAGAVVDLAKYVGNALVSPPLGIGSDALAAVPDRDSPPPPPVGGNAAGKKPVAATAAVATKGGADAPGGKQRAAPVGAALATHQVTRFVLEGRGGATGPRPPALSTSAAEPLNEGGLAALGATLWKAADSPLGFDEAIRLHAGGGLLLSAEQTDSLHARAARLTVLERADGARSLAATLLLQGDERQEELPVDDAFFAKLSGGSRDELELRSRLASLLVADEFVVRQTSAGLAVVDAV